MELLGKIDENGVIKLYDRELLSEWLKDNSGKDIRLKIEVRRKRRSDDQNRYYWGVCIPMIKDALNHYGNEFTKDYTHEFLKIHCNSREIEIKDGLHIQAPVSTANLTIVDFMDYLERVRRFAGESLGIYIPNPNEQIAMEF